jgi:hypothetical protein
MPPVLPERLEFESRFRVCPGLPSLAGLVTVVRARATVPTERVRIMLAAAVLAMLTTAGAVDLTPYFPVPSGAVWTYDRNGVVYTTTMTGAGSFEGAPVQVFENSYLNDASRRFLFFLSSGSAGVLYHGNSYSLGQDEGQTAYDPPRLQLPDALQVGDSVTSTSEQVVSVNGQVAADPGSVTRVVDTITLGGSETLTVPAGTFAVVKIQASSRVTTSIPLNGGFSFIVSDTTSVRDEWYAPGIGLVKAFEDDPGEGAVTTVLVSTNANSVDSDGDGIPDAQDAFPNDADDHPARTILTVIGALLLETD